MDERIEVALGELAKLLRAQEAFWEDEVDREFCPDWRAGVSEGRRRAGVLLSAAVDQLRVDLG